MDALAALGDPTRRRIVEMLAKRPRSSGELAGAFTVSASAVSQHLKVLREVRLVRVRVEAQRRIYLLDRAGVEEIADWVQNLRVFWSGRLDALDAQLTAESAEEGGDE